MSRDLNADLLAAINAAALRPVRFVEAEFTGGWLRLWTGVGTVEWDGKTWTGAGNLLGLSEISEHSDIRASGITVSLSGLNPSIISLALAQARQGLPCRVYEGFLTREGYLSLPGTSGNYASTPDSAAVSVTGNIDIRVKAALDDWTPGGGVYQCLVCKGTDFIFSVNDAGALNLASLSLFATSNVAVSFTDGEESHVRMTRESASGDLKFFTSADGISWTQLGTTLPTTAGLLADSASSVDVGARGPDSGDVWYSTGKIYSAEIRDGIDGTVVARFDPSADAIHGGKSFTSRETGDVWTINQSGSPHAAIVLDDTAIIADPLLSFEGRLDVPEIDDSADTCAVSISYESRLIDLERPRERRITHEDQQIDYPGDQGRAQVAVLQDKVVTW